jgi:hypothetical protein
VDSSAAEAGDLTGCVQPRDGRPVGTQCPRRQIGLDTAEGLSGQDVKFHADQRTGLRVEDAVWCRGARNAVAQVTPGVSDPLYLSVFGERIGHLGVP